MTENRRLPRSAPKEVRPKRSASKMLHVVTIATHSERMFPILQESAKRNGVPLTILGRNHPWKDFASKMDILLPFFRSQPEEDIICYLDGFDSLILPPIRHLEKTSSPLVRALFFPMTIGTRGYKVFLKRNSFPTNMFFPRESLLGKTKRCKIYFWQLERCTPTTLMIKKSYGATMFIKIVPIKLVLRWL